MSSENFVDYVKINCRSGKGGAGSTHFHRARFLPKGGPDGGNGGRGGDIILQGDSNTWTLLPLKYRKHIIASNGQNGMGNNKTGKDGEDVILKVPLGTIARDFESGEIECEIVHHGERCVLLKGGRGGLGNTNFKTSTNQAPRYSQPGEPGREEWKILELKLLADVGLVGFPNAGKSTLLSVLSAAKPKIGNYPFTTLRPQLGVVEYKGGQSFVMADIPGIIEDAHKGKGLGHRFLRHIERNSILLILIPADVDDINEEYRIILNELGKYNPELLDKEHLVAISKSDVLDEELKKLLAREFEFQAPHLFISAAAQKGLEELLDKLWGMLQEPLYDEEE